MNEYTVVTTIQFTEIIRAEAFDLDEYKKELTEALIEEGELDDVEIKSCKVFPREMNDG